MIVKYKTDHNIIIRCKGVITWPCLICSFLPLTVVALHSGCHQYNRGNICNIDKRTYSTFFFALFSWLTCFTSLALIIYLDYFFVYSLHFIYFRFYFSRFSRFTCRIYFFTCLTPFTSMTLAALLALRYLLCLLFPCYITEQIEFRFAWRFSFFYEFYILGWLV